MKPKLDVVIIATVRADILRLTLASFTKKLLHQFNCRAIINVDPLGETDRNTPMDMVNICREYFAEVIHKTPHKPSFAKAVQWGWQQVQTEFFFHLEDDWILKRQIKANEFMQPMQDKKICGFVLNRTPNAESESAFSLNPCLLRTACIKEMLKSMDVNKDPEFQFNKTTNSKLQILKHISNNPIVVDSGRIWRRKYFIGKGNSISRPTWYAKTDNKIKSIPRQIRYEFYKQFWRLLYG